MYEVSEEHVKYFHHDTDATERDTRDDWTQQLWRIISGAEFDRTCLVKYGKVLAGQFS
jgi:hypothetical protein